MPSILLLHGVPADGRLWDGVRPHLSSRHPAIHTPSLPGYGGGPDLAPPTVDAHVDWLAARHPTEALHVVGQDYGGLLAARMAVRHPDRVRSVTLISAAVGLGWAWARLGALPGPHLLFYRTFGGGLWHHQGVARARRAAFAEAFGHHRNDPTLPARMRTMARALCFRQLARLPDALGKTRVPLLTLWGTSDRFSPWPAALWMAHRHRRHGGLARTVLIPGGRHYLPFDRPAQTARALDRFWDTVDSSKVE